MKKRQENNLQRSIPYVGVTGIMHRHEVTELLTEIMNWQGVDIQRYLMVGVLVTEKTLNGPHNNEVNRYPFLKKIPPLFLSDPGCLNILHLYFKGSMADLLVCVRKFIHAVGHTVHGFQFNVPRLEAWVIEVLKKEYPHLKFIVQMNHHALQDVSHNPKLLADKIKNEYEGIADYVLIDESMGKGLSLDPIKMQRYLDEIYINTKTIGVGIAGNLGLNTLKLVQPLTDRYPDLSMDAETALRTEDDHLDLLVAKKYVYSVFSMFTRF